MGNSLVSRKQIEVLAVFAILLAASVYVGTTMGFLNFSTASAGTAAATIASGGTCPSTGLTNMKYSAQYLDSSTGTNTVVNTSVDVYEGVGASTGTNTLFAGTTGTAGYVTAGTLNCGKAATSYIGDGGATYYYQKIETTATQTTGADTTILAKLKKSSTVTVTFQNSSSSGWAATVGQSGVGSGATNSDVTMRVKAGQYYFGDGAFEVCAQFATSNISKVSFGGDATEIAVDKSLAVGAGTDTRCYEVKADMSNYASKDLPVVIQAASGVTPSASAIRIYVNDAASRIKNGQLVDKYFNSDTSANLGLAAVNVGTAVTVN